MFRFRLGTMISLLGLTLSLSAQALDLKLPADLSSQEKQTLQNLTQDVLSKLPPAISQQLQSTEVNLRLEELRERRMGEFVHGDIVISKQLLDQVANAADAEKISVNAVFAQHHGNIKELLEATLIHEIGHLYDAKAHLSQQPHFMDVAGFPLVGLISDHKRRRINFLENRAVDPYEWTNPKEAFAVNLEYFLLDPQFQCREPLMNETLSHAMQDYRPFATSDCQRTQMIMVAGSSMTGSAGYFEKIDPSRVYQVHYFFAGKGNANMSRFGHAMLRLVVCAPERTTVGPECLQDIGSHLIVSFRAAVDDFKINTWAGLRGDYPSIPFMLPLTNVVPEYTKLELREIHSIPLNLTRAEIRSVVQVATELHWNYEGKYKFLSNNCADETLRLLKLALPQREGIQKMSVARPDSLLKKLTAIGITDVTHDQDLKQALVDGYYFPSKRTLYDLAIGQLQKAAVLDQKMDLDTYLKTTPEQRAQLISQVEQQADASLQNKELAALLSLEDLHFLRDKQAVFKELIDTVMKNQKKIQGTELQQDLETSKKIMALFSSPSHLLLKTGYGLPLDQEILDIAKNQEVIDSNLKVKTVQADIEKEMKNWVKPETLERLQQTKANEAELLQKFAHQTK